MSDPTNHVFARVFETRAAVLLLASLAVLPSCQQKPIPPAESAGGVLERDGRTLESWMTDLGASDLLIQTLAVRAVGSFGAASVDSLRARITTSDPSAVVGATQALAIVGPPAVAAVPELEANLHHAHPRIRSESARALGAIGPAAAAAAGALATATADPDWDTRFQAITSLGAIGATDGLGGDCLSCLSRHDADRRLRFAAATALRGAPASWKGPCPPATAAIR